MTRRVSRLRHADGRGRSAARAPSLVDGVDRGRPRRRRRRRRARRLAAVAAARRSPSPVLAPVRQSCRAGSPSVADTVDADADLPHADVGRRRSSTTNAGRSRRCAPTSIDARTSMRHPRRTRRWSSPRRADGPRAQPTRSAPSRADSREIAARRRARASCASPTTRRTARADSTSRRRRADRVPTPSRGAALDDGRGALRRSRSRRASRPIPTTGVCAASLPKRCSRRAIATAAFRELESAMTGAEHAGDLDLASALAEEIARLEPDVGASTIRSASSTRSARTTARA